MARFGQGFGTQSRRGGTAGGAPPQVPGLTRPDFADLGLTPLFLYHPHSDTVTLSGEQVTGVTGTGGSPDLVAPTSGPDRIVDARGATCWRFEGSDFLELPMSFTSTPRSMALFIVGRQHQNHTVNFFGHSFQSDGVTVANTLSAFLSTSSSGGLLATLKTGSVNTSSDAANKAYMAVGAQLSCFGIASRTTANGGCRFYNGSRVATTAQNPSALTNCKGARIGGYLNANGTTNGFDLYAIVAFAGELTNAQADAVQARLMGHFSVIPFIRQIVLEGDSITAGIVEVTSGYNLGMAVAAPGAGLIPPDTRVLNMGVSGAQMTNLVARRDLANGWPVALLPGGSANNIVAAQIGRNDSASGGQNETQIRDAIIAYLNTATTGVFARGFDVRWAINIANGAMGTLGPLRTLLRDASFKALCDAQSGGANAGRLGLIELPLIENPAGTRRFDLAASASDTAHYQAGDTTHPGKAGTALLASGGVTPQHGYAGIF